MTFDDLLRDHGPALWRVIASYAPPGAERADLAQDVMVSVWQGLPRFRGARTPKLPPSSASPRRTSPSASAGPARRCANRSRRRKQHDGRRVDHVAGELDERKRAASRGPCPGEEGGAAPSLREPGVLRAGRL